MQRVTGAELAGLFSRNIAGLFFDNHSQFHFPIYFLRSPGNHEGIIWPHDRGRGFEEQHWLGRKLHAAFSSVIAIIEADTDDLARAAGGRAQAFLWAYAMPGGYRTAGGRRGHSSLSVAAAPGRRFQKPPRHSRKQRSRHQAGSDRPTARPASPPLVRQIE